MNFLKRDDFDCIPRNRDILQKEKKYSTHHFKLNSKIIRAGIISAIALTIGAGTIELISEHTSKPESGLVKHPPHEQDSVVVVETTEVQNPGTDIAQVTDAIKKEFIDLLAQNNIYDYSKYYEVSNKKIKSLFSHLSDNIVSQLPKLKEEKIEDMLFAKDFAWYLAAKHKQRPTLQDKILTGDDRKKILDIMESNEFKIAVKSSYTNISFHRLFSLAQAIARNIPYRYSFNNVDPHVRQSRTEWYIAQLKSFEKTTIVSKDVNVCMISSSDFAPGSKKFIQRYTSLSKDSSKVVSNQSIPLHATEQQAKAQVNIFQHSIEKSVGPTCIILQSHGAYNWDNGVPTSTVALGTYTTGYPGGACVQIRPEELGAWMAHSGNKNNLSNFRIILPSCLGYRYITTLLDYLSAHDTKGSPTVIVFANDGKDAFGQRGYDDFLIPFKDFTNKKELKGIDFLQMENKQSKNDPAFFIAAPQSSQPKNSFYTKKYVEVSEGPTVQTGTPCS
ncbi:MAG: hypothetical protein NTX91_02255 [candidate division SR1 bacterium]|nr:hypothetical protein [candidate division SR1 bacterium]